jgi:hypothetical protein
LSSAVLGAVIRVASGTGMYWKVLECTGMENVLENVLEKGCFLVYWKNVLELFRNFLVNVLDNCCKGKMYWDFLKREHVGPNVGFRGSTILKIKIFGCFAAIPLTSSPYYPQYYSSESYIIIFITY